MMKKILILIMLLNVTTLVAQWERLYPQPTEKHLYTASFINDNVGFLVGEKGTILKTTDAGKTYNKISHSLSADILNIKFINEHTGYIITPPQGYSPYFQPNKVYKTINGGQSWSKINLQPYSISPKTLFFLDEEIGWLGGGSGQILKTTNGGEDWMLQYSPTGSSSIIQIQFINKNIGWALVSSSRFLRTTNGGSSWEMKQDSIISSQSFLFKNENWGIISSPPNGFITNIAITSDGGNSWEQRSIGFNLTPRQFFIKDSLIIVAARTRIGVSSDLGETWESRPSSWQGNFPRFSYIINENFSIIIGDGGRIRETRDQGLTWNYATSFAEGNKFCFIDSLNGYTSTSYYTMDGGLTWNKNNLNIPRGDYIFFDKLKGIALYPGINKTTDGGQTWYQVSNESFSKLFFVDSLYGWVYRKNWVNKQEISRTTDGGETWSEIKIINKRGTPSCIYFTSRNRGFIAGYDGHGQSTRLGLRTTDGGETWHDNEFALISRNLFFLDSLTGYGVWSEVFKTTDGGNTFNNLGLVEPNTELDPKPALLFTDENNGWYGGKWLYKTTDGGFTWAVEDSSPRRIYDIQVLPNRILAIGEYGFLIKKELSPVPVQLTSFSASIQQNSVHLTWQTSTETNNKGFELERREHSAESKVWETVAFIPGSGTTTEPQQYSFIDENVSSGKYKYKLIQVDFDGTRTDEEEIEVEVNNAPKEFALFQNYPNPFNPVTNLRFTIPTHSAGKSDLRFVELKIYDILGNEITTLVNEAKEPGEYEVEFNGSKYSSGVYFYTLQAGDFTASKKFVLMK